ncbi:MAG: S1C family serine protease, partial [Candidatus Limnocylindria bacterium]
PGGQAGSGGPGAPATALREVTAQEKAALQATADRVRSSAVVVGEIKGGGFAPGGSGFVYSADGLVMTNSHVLAEIGGTPQVMLADGRVLPAERIGRVTSLQPDVAVLRVRGSGLTVAETGDSNSVRFGDPLVAVAHPRGFGYWLATAGQAYGQKDASAGASMGFVTELYSNVPSGPGASGGPLFNAKGQVIGLLFAGSGEGAPEVIAPSPLTVIRDPLQWSAIAERPRTTAVAINDALGAAREIVAQSGDLPSWSRPFSIPEHRLQGAQLQVLSAAEITSLPTDLAGSIQQSLSGPHPDLRVVEARRNAEGYLVTFSAAPPAGAFDFVLTMFGTFSHSPQEVAGSVPDKVVEAVAVPAPAADDERVLGFVRPLLPGIVHIAGRTGGTVEQGTGSVITADGYILTNAHVIDDTANTYEVTLHDGRRFTARRVGIVTSQKPDVGVLKIDATGLLPLAVGDPAALRPGAPLYLVGHPKDRGYWRLSTGPFQETDGSEGHAELLASLSFAGGNSGGAFLNERGEMVGVFHGTPPTSAAAIRASAPEVVWGWHEFDQLFGEGNARATLAAAAAIDVAMARAQQIIQRQGDVP